MIDLYRLKVILPFLQVNLHTFFYNMVQIYERKRKRKRWSFVFFVQTVHFGLSTSAFIYLQKKKNDGEPGKCFKYHTQNDTSETDKLSEDTLAPWRDVLSGKGLFTTTFGDRTAISFFHPWGWDCLLKDGQSLVTVYVCGKEMVDAWLRK